MKKAPFVFVVAAGADIYVRPGFRGHIKGRTKHPAQRVVGVETSMVQPLCLIDYNAFHVCRRKFLTFVVVVVVVVACLFVASHTDLDVLCCVLCWRLTPISAGTKISL